MTSIIRRSVGTVYNHTSTTACTIPKPAGLAVGDVMYAGIGTLVSGTITPPTATGTWTLVASELANGNVKQWVYRKVAVTADVSATSFAFVLSASSKNAGRIWAGENVDTTTPEDSFASGGAATTASVTASDVIGGAGAWSLTFAFSRHGFAAARPLSTSDTSDSLASHDESSSGSGFDYSSALWDSSRDLSAGTDSDTISTSTGTENWISWIKIGVRPAVPPTLKARTYQFGLILPGTPAVLRARTYRIGLTLPAPDGGLKARTYQIGLLLPVPGGHPTVSGFYILQGGVLKPMVMYSCVNGQIQ